MLRMKVKESHTESRTFLIAQWLYTYFFTVPIMQYYPDDGASWELFRTPLYSPPPFLRLADLRIFG